MKLVPGYLLMSCCSRLMIVAILVLNVCTTNGPQSGPYAEFVPQIVDGIRETELVEIDRWIKQVRAVSFRWCHG